MAIAATMGRVSCRRPFADTPVKGVMVVRQAPPTRNVGIQARIWIWTIRNQRFISRTVVFYVWSAATALLLLAVMDRIPMQTALHGIFFGGMVLMIALWALIERRRTWLHRLSDSSEKAAAYDAMCEFLESKRIIERNGHPRRRCRHPGGGRR